MTTYEKIRQLCEQNGFTISNIEKHIIGLNVKASSVTGWKRGSKPSPKNLRLIAAHFGVPVEYFDDDYDDSSSVKIPVYGRVAAGIPIAAIQEILDYEEIPKRMACDGDYFALQVQGDSMYPRICSGDIVILRQQDFCEDGQIAVVLVGNEDATLKKVIWRAGGVSLIPINPAYPIHNYTADEIRNLPIKILGVAKEVRGKL